MTAHMDGVDSRRGVRGLCRMARMGRPTPGVVLPHTRQLTSEDGRGAGRHDERQNESLQPPNHLREYMLVDHVVTARHAAAAEHYR
jgi:hypothetical protein